MNLSLATLHFHRYLPIVVSSTLFSVGLPRFGALVPFRASHIVPPHSACPSQKKPSPHYPEFFYRYGRAAHHRLRTFDTPIERSAYSLPSENPRAGKFSASLPTRVVRTSASVQKGSTPTDPSSPRCQKRP